MAKKKIKVLPKEEFFAEISSRANYINPDIIKDIYYALLKTIVKELREKGAVEMPDLGVFVEHKHKARMALNVCTRVVTFLPEKSTIKFKTCDKLKKYFHLKG